MKFWPLLPAVILFLLQIYVRAIRWKLLLPVDHLSADHPLKLKSLFDSIIVGNLANFLLPMRAGEFIRPYLLSNYQPGISFGSGLISVIVERFFDLSCVLSLFAVVTLINHNLPAEVAYGAYLLSALAFGIFMFMILGSLFEKHLLKLINYTASFLPEKIKATFLEFFTQFLQGTSLVVRSPKRGFLITCLTIVVWALTVALHVVFFWLFDLQVNLEIAAATTVIVALAVAAPSAPGFIGVYQWGCLASFSLYGLPAGKAVAFSIITHLFNYLIFIVLGGWIIWRDGIKLMDLSDKAKNTTSS